MIYLKGRLKVLQHVLPTFDCCLHWLGNILLKVWLLVAINSWWCWLTHCGQATPYEDPCMGIWVNIGCSNGLLPDGTKPLLGPILTSHSVSAKLFSSKSASNRILDVVQYILIQRNRLNIGHEVTNFDKSWCASVVWQALLISEVMCHLPESSFTHLNNPATNLFNESMLYLSVKFWMLIIIFFLAKPRGVKLP